MSDTPCLEVAQVGKMDGVLARVFFNLFSLRHFEVVAILRFLGTDFAPAFQPLSTPLPPPFSCTTLTPNPTFPLTHSLDTGTIFTLESSLKELDLIPFLKVLLFLFVLFGVSFVIRPLLEK